MIKVFTTNKDGKIELTKDELKALLDEAYWDGYRAHNITYTYTTPSWTPYQWSVTTKTNSVKLDSNAMQNGTINSCKTDTETIA